ncbi:MAG: hypothetical protein O3B01_04330 [Planctomycetota bacterium]|nr:hypothetical protein [Planctomycetota bacterium]
MLIGYGSSDLGLQTFKGSFRAQVKALLNAFEQVLLLFDAGLCLLSEVGLVIVEIAKQFGSL